MRHPLGAADLKRIFISTHAPLARCDGHWTPAHAPSPFQLTHLLRGATPADTQGGLHMVISTHAPLARCDNGTRGQFSICWISTHAPLARCDSEYPEAAGWYRISTHAPLARCDMALERKLQEHPFQLTHLLRGATGGIVSRQGGIIFQLTHLLRGATGVKIQHGGQLNFNSRTSCEVRLRPQRTTPCLRRFQLTHLLRGATAIYCSTFISQTHHLVRGGQVNQIIDLSGVKYCPVLARTGNDFCIIHGSLKHYKIIGPSGS